MANHSLEFEDIALSTNIITTNTETRFPTRPSNNAEGSPAYKYTVQRSRTGQVYNDYRNPDGNTPICAYHMPRNTQRFNDPRLFLETKQPKDIIEAKDLNDLFDRIDLYLYAWNAEKLNIFNYAATEDRRGIGRNASSLIESDGHNNDISITPEHSLNDANSVLDAEYFFYQVEGSSYDDIRAQLDAVTPSSGVLDDYPIGGQLPFGLPKINWLGAGMDDINHTTGSEPVINPSLSGATSTPETLNATSEASPNGGLIVHFGRVTTQDATIMNPGSSNGNYQMKFRLGSKVDAPKFWEVNFNGTSFTPYLSEAQPELIYTIRDQNEDPLDEATRTIGNVTQPTPDSKEIWYGIKLVTRPQVVIPSKSGKYLTYDDIRRPKNGNYPEIGVNEWVRTRATLKVMLDRLNSAAVASPDGTSDSATINDISTFFTTNASYAGSPTKDEPDTSFGGYGISSGTIIKVEFYNILVGAYELMVNSCICNTDCACNVDCICNVNCGCNYG